MWSLPSIERLNAQAVAEHRKRKGRAPSPRGKTCDSCDRKAKHMIPWHDPFGDAKTREIPKGYLAVCDECYDSGRWTEGYFDCDSCGKMHTENYTWELYYQDTEGGRICLECAFNRALDSDGPDSPWVYQKDVDRLEKWLKDGKGDVAFDWIRRKAHHLIGVETTYWQDRLIFQGNVELDSSSGTRITGFSSAESSRDGGVREIVDHLKKVLANTSMRDFMVALGRKDEMPDARCALILDGGYQFCVSIGIYFERKYSGAALKKEVAR